MSTKFKILIFSSIFLITACQSRKPYIPDTGDDGFLDEPYNEQTNYDNVPSKIGPETTLQDLLKYAALNNASLKAAYLNWQAEIFKVYPAGALPDPQVSYTYYIQEVETRVGPQRHSLGFMQMLPWFGKLDLKEALQKAAVKSRKAEYDAVRNELFSKVEQLYSDYWYLQQSQRITEENLKLLNSLEPVVRNRIKVGEGTKDLIKLQIEIAKLTDVRDNLKLRKVPLDAKLNSLLNRPARAEVGLIAILGKVQEKWDEEKLLTSVKNNPALQKFEFLKESASVKAELADNNRYPNFELGLKWIQTDDSFMNTRENGKDPVMATIGFTVPWDQRKYDQLVAAARSEYRSVNWAKRAFKNTLEMRLKTALFEIEDNLRVIKLYRDTLIPKTEESLAISMQAYRNAKESFIGFVDIQRQLLSFQLVLEKARKNISIQKAVIEEITGEKISPDGGNHE